MQRVWSDDRSSALASAAAATLAVAIVLVNLRMEPSWSRGAQLAITAATFALLATWAAVAPAERRLERAIVGVSALALLVPLLIRGDQSVGVEAPGDHSGAITWMAATFAACAALAFVRLRSPVFVLLASLGFAATVIAFVDWTSGISDPDTFRWVFAALSVAFVLAASIARLAGAASATQFLNAAGVAAFAVAGTFLVFLVFGDGGFPPSSWGWELVVLAAGALLVLLGALWREAAPRYWGFFLLLSFAVIAAPSADDSPSLVGWPLALLIVAGLLLLAAVAGGSRRSPPPHS